LGRSAQIGGGLFLQSGSLFTPLPDGNKQTRHYALAIAPQTSAFGQNGFMTTAKSCFNLALGFEFDVTSLRLCTNCARTGCFETVGVSL
jgi:hypothetical protein